MCRIEHWRVRTLRTKIDSMLFERAALSRKPEKLIAHEFEHLRQDDLLTPDLVFRVPYFLDFLGLKDTCQEKENRRSSRSTPSYISPFFAFKANQN